MGDKVDYNLFTVHFDHGIPDTNPPIYLGRLKGQVAGRECVAVIKLKASSKRGQIDEEMQQLIDFGISPNLVQYKCHHVAKPDNDLYLAMEQCLGTLDSFKLEGHDFETRRNILVHIMTGLNKIHKKGVAHGFVKPSYIHLSLDGRNVKLAGFGLYRLIHEKTVSTGRPDVIHIWGSPEHYDRRNINNVTPESDIFSAGLIFHRVLSGGKHPFDDDLIPQSKKKAYAKKIRAKIRGESPIIRLDISSYKKLAQQLISEMLEKVVKSRPTVRDVLRHPLLWKQTDKQKCIKRIQDHWEKFNLSTKQWIAGRISNFEMDAKGEPRTQDDYLLLYVELVHFKCTDTDADNWDQVMELVETLKKFDVETQCSDIPTSVDFGMTEFEKPVEKVQEFSFKECHGIEDKFIFNEGDPIKPGTAVFKGLVDGENKVAKENVVFKCMPANDENRQAIEVVSDCSSKGFIAVKRSYCKMLYEQDYYYILMEPFITTPFVELTRLNNEMCSPQMKIESVYHIVAALCSFHEDGFTHGNITEGKFLLSRDGNDVFLLGSKQMKRSSSFDNVVKDAQKTAIVVANLMTGEGINPENNKTLEDLERSVKANGRFDRELLVDFLRTMWESGETSGGTGTDECKIATYTNTLLSHPFFWGPDRKLEFEADVYGFFEGKNDLKSLNAINPPSKWTSRLTLFKQERLKWFDGDSSGTVHRKATAVNAKFDDKRTDTLLNLIRNCHAHLLFDMISKDRKKHDLRGEQTLFKTKADIGEFFYSRFPDLFYDVYKFIRTEEKYRTNLGEYFSVPHIKRELKFNVGGMGSQ